MQTRSETMSAMPAYPFLSQPPQELYKSPEPSQGHHARRRSLAAISNWASSVQPGAPAPISPTKAKYTESVTARPAEIRAMRRHSVKPAPAPPSPVGYLPDSPSSSDQSTTPTTKPDFKRDLQTGYTSVYVTLPEGRAPPTPTTPTAPSVPAPSRKGFTRLLSLKPASSSSSSPASSSKEKTKEKKKSKYDEARPAQLATDLALAQLMGGGTIEHHMRQEANREAKRAGAKKVNGQYVGVEVLHRDAEGRVWRDRDEELEYAGLLDREGPRAESQEWVRFSEDSGRTSQSSSVENHERSRHHGKSKRRPEPLDLAPSMPHGSHRTHAVDSMDARREFLQSSFAPAAAPMESQVSLDVSSGKKTGLKMSMKGMFKKSSH